MIGRPLPRVFYARPTHLVARRLLGQLLVSDIGGRRVVGRIVETEAYVGPDDPACHAWHWHRSAANESLYGPPGDAYVYFTYGMHWCLNAVTRPPEFPAAVLIRALEPLQGLEVMRRRRGGVADALLCSGPARLCQALGVDRRQDGASLQRGRLRVVRPLRPPARLRVARGPRIGISRAVRRPLRFWIAESPWVSR